MPTRRVPRWASFLYVVCVIVTVGVGWLWFTVGAILFFVVAEGAAIYGIVAVLDWLTGRTPPPSVTGDGGATSADMGNLV